jgi:hypothetical protein
VTETSRALVLEEGVFTLRDPRRIARSLKRSAERSRRRRAEPFRSAMSMLTFYINRAGRHLPAVQRARLESAKDELRDLFGRPRPGPGRLGHNGPARTGAMHGTRAAAARWEDRDRDGCRARRGRGDRARAGGGGGAGRRVGTDAGRDRPHRGGHRGARR